MRSRLVLGAAGLMGALIVTSATLSQGAPKKTGVRGTQVSVIRTPDRGIQPQAAVDAEGNLHLVFFKGTPGAGDVFYVRRAAGSSEFSSPLQVNSQAGSAIAVGTIRGAHLALGKGGRVHVAWNGSNAAKIDGKNPMLYTRLNDAGDRFEPQRNVIQTAYGLDGGGSVAADDEGNVFVAWHAGDKEANRRLWVAVSHDEGQTFAPETQASTTGGACGCCGMRAAADHNGTLYMLYRSARDGKNRDMHLVTSTDGGRSYQETAVDKWDIATCPMSSEAFAIGDKSVIAAWETEGQVLFSILDGKTHRTGKTLKPAGGEKNRKHPSVATNSNGDVLLAWTEGTGWERGGALAWQMFDKSGKATQKGRQEGVPVWGLPTAVTTPDGNFVIVY
ncbi:MAG TPA: sialidase family protein [Planctomycetaceae bacterium]|nr:sialidase family protein [Planctomycetaceae bacterium]